MGKKYSLEITDLETRGGASIRINAFLCRCFLISFSSRLQSRNKIWNECRSYENKFSY